MMSEHIELGYITGFSGVKGWVKIFSYTRPRSGIENYSQFYLGQAKKPINFTTIKSSGKFIIGHIEQIDSRELAQPYIGETLYIPSEALPDLVGEYYWHQLIGLSVSNKQGQQLGQVKSLIETGVNDVLIIQQDNHEVLIPFVLNHFVLQIDLVQKTMLVDWEVDED